MVTTGPACILSAQVSKTDVSCNGGTNGTATVIASGGSNYTYAWNTNPVQTGASANNLSAGTYLVTVTAGCSATTTATVTINEPSSLVGSVTSSAACIGSNGQINISASGGTAPYMYSSDGINFQSSNNFIFPPGNYVIRIKDFAGCIDSVQATIDALPFSNSSFTASACSAYTLPWGTQVTSSGIYVHTYQGINGCDSIVTANISISPVVSSSQSLNICSNELPFTWNGQGIIAAGIYKDTLISQSGCDSIVTLTLAVNPVVFSTTNHVVCQSQLPYVWNGISINAAGSYSDTLTSQGGCDSVATLLLNVNPVVTSTSIQTYCQSWLPFTWNGQVITAAGTYTANLVSSTGCDSIVSLQLNVMQEVTDTITQVICQSQLPYTWNGLVITQGGVYSDTFVSNASCDSIITLVLTVSPIVTSTTTQTLCQNQLPYTWNGQTITAAGIYTDTTTSQSGCDSIATLILTVSPLLTDTTSVSVCTSQLPYTWNGQNITAAGIYTDTTTSQSGCDSIATLILTVSPVLTDTTSVSVCTSQLPYTWNGQQITQAGTYSDTLSSGSGCDSIATLVLTVNPIVTSTTTQSVCQNQLPYIWNGISIPAAGTYHDTLISQSGCDSIATLILNVNPVVTSTSIQTYCVNQLPITWNGQTISAAGNYTATLVSSNGCDSIANLQLNVSPILTSTVTEAICQTQLPYTWNGQVISQAGTYTHSFVSNAGCDSIATLILEISPSANVTMTGADTICQGEASIISFDITGNAPWTLVYTDGTNIYTIDSIMTSPFQLSVSPATTTTYSVVSISSGECTNVITNSSVTITVLPTVQGIRYPTVNTSEFVNTQLTARILGFGHTYNWTPPTGLSATNIFNPIFNHNNSTNYLITITSPNGCKVVDTISVLVKPTEAPPTIKSDIFVPKAWSPNRDGHNDRLRPICIRIKEIKYFRIFNRWGQLMYETNKIGEGWDGIFQNKAQISDVYTWTLEAYGEDGQHFKRAGNAVLLR